MLGVVVPKLVWYELTWPKELDTEQVHEWLQAIGGNNGRQGMRFVVVASSGSIKHYLALPSLHEQNILEHVTSFLPGVETTSRSTSRHV